MHQRRHASHVELFSLAFGHEHEYCEAFFAYHDTPDGRAGGSERMLAFKANPVVTFITFADSNGKMIAGAK
jgi:hypothetical protein